jgi:hypothetical protein
MAGLPLSSCPLLLPHNPTKQTHPPAARRAHSRRNLRGWRRRWLLPALPRTATTPAAQAA